MSLPFWSTQCENKAWKQMQHVTQAFVIYLRQHVSEAAVNVDNPYLIVFMFILPLSMSTCPCLVCTLCMVICPHSKRRSYFPKLPLKNELPNSSSIITLLGSRLYCNYVILLSTTEFLFPSIFVSNQNKANICEDVSL